MSIEILKVRLLEAKKGNGLLLHIDRGEEGSALETHKPVIHRDLKTALDGLRAHLALMVGFLQPIEIPTIAHPDQSKIENFFVKGYSIGGDEDQGTRGVIISGHKILSNGMAHNFNTPFYRFEQAPESRYVYMDDLLARISVIEQEIGLYLSGEKRGVDPQLEMFEEEKPKEKRERKKVRQTAENPNGEVLV